MQYLRRLGLPFAIAIPVLGLCFAYGAHPNSRCDRHHPARGKMALV